MLRNWAGYTLKKQLLILFGLLSTISLTLIGVMCIIYIAVAGNQIYTVLFNGFLNNSQSSISTIMTNGAQLFDMKLAQLTYNFPNQMVTNAEDSFRSDYPFGNIQSYYNWPGQLPNATYSPVYSANVTYLHSSINIYNVTFPELSTVNSYIKNIINKTAQMDYLFVPTFANNPDFLAGYMSTPTQFLRYYPGVVNDNTLSTYIMYNNLDDYWYVTTMENPISTLPVYTSPYYDPIAKELMITISHVVHNPYDMSVLGAFGADMMLRSIQNDIQQLTYLNESRTILFEKESGYVIADSGAQVTNLMTYKDITNLSVSSNVWNSLLATTNTLVLDNENYFLSVNLNTSNGKYMLVSIIDKKYVINPFSSIINSISTIISIEIAVVIIVSIIIIIITIIVTVILTNHIVAPLQRLSDISSKMAGRIGEASLTNGIDVNIDHTGITEIDNMTSAFKNTVDQLGKNKEQVGNKTDNNTYYGNVPWSAIRIPEMSPGILQPPPYTEF